MITKFKIYEENIDEPQIGDYVICSEKDNQTLDKRLKTQIGKIIRFVNNDLPNIYLVQFEKIPSIFHHYDTNCRSMALDEILYHSKNKEDLEHILKANKYNL